MKYIRRSLAICGLAIIVILVLIMIDFLACSYFSVQNTAQDYICRIVRRILSPVMPWFLYLQRTRTNINVRVFLFYPYQSKA